MKVDRKANSRAKFAEATNFLLDAIHNNAYKNNEKQTIIEVTIKGETEETLEFEIENLNEIIKLFRLNS